VPISRSANGIVRPRLGIDLRRDTGHFAGKRFHRDRRENRVQVGAPLLCLTGGLRTMQTVLEFHDGYGGEDDLSLAVLLSKVDQHRTHRLGIALGGDQHAGVED